MTRPGGIVLVLALVGICACKPTNRGQSDAATLFHDGPSAAEKPPKDAALGSVRGIVTAGGVPQKGVLIRLGNAGRIRDARSDERGRFILSELSPGAYALAADLPAKNLGAFLPVDVGLLPDATAVEVNIELHPTVRILGIVRDEANHPLPGAFVLVEEDARPLPLELETGADGRFVATQRARGRDYRISVRRAGYLSDARVVRAGGGAIEIKLRRGATLEGLVVDEHGAPITGAELAVVSDDGEVLQNEAQPRGPAPPTSDSWARLEAAGELGVLPGPIPFPPLQAPAASAEAVALSLPHSDGKGAFRIAELPAGHLIVTARHSDFAAAATMPVALVAGAVRSVRIELVRGASLRGSILDERGLGIADAQITTSDGRTALSDATGHFSIEHLAKTVHLSARARGFLRGEVAVEALPGQAEVNATLTLRRALGALGGQITDARGTPIEGARLSVTPSGGEVAHAVSDRDGRFLVDGLPEGPYALLVEQTSWAPLRLPSIAATPDARLVLDPGGGIEGELFDARTGSPPADARVEIMAGGDLHRARLEGRHFRVVALPAGLATLTAIARGYPRVERTLDIPSGARAGEITVRDLRIELELGGQVRGRVLDEHGDPVGNAEIGTNTGLVDAVHSLADGTYLLVGVPNGRVHVRARADGRAVEDDAEVRANEESRLDLTLPPKD